ncbi:MAG: isochorismatase family protein [Chitinophagaceae bacterium]|nr:isochorismatase family protein [Rubrivivax sp.]
MPTGSHPIEAGAHGHECRSSTYGASAGVLAGCEAHVCLLQTALGVLRSGRRVWVVAPACGSRAAGDHTMAMARLREAGAGIVANEMAAFEWLARCRHPRCKEVLALVKGH